MRAKCKRWTDELKVFAVIDSFAWHDANQLCITQEGHTPLLTSYTETTSYLGKGAPNLWWAGADGCHIIRNLVSWAVKTKAITKDTKFGIVTSDADVDKAGVNECLKPALRRAGLTPRATETLHYDINNPGAAAPQAGPAVVDLQTKQVTVVIPLAVYFPYNSFIAALKTQTRYRPRLLLSDFDSILSVSLGMVESGFKDVLQDMSGPTFGVLGSRDYKPYDGPLGASCDDAWHQNNRGTPDIEATGTAMTWCQNIRLFAEAARRAGANLTRERFNQAMASITSFAGGTIPNLRFGQGVYSGPHLQRIVAVHENSDHKCVVKRKDGSDHGSCWQVLSGYREMSLA
jgi:hypothetical protein